MNYYELIFCNLRLGFHDYITIDDLSQIFPELDYVNHKRRKEIQVNSNRRI